jgi:2-(1,2-epoxy-1,2-dihydrophenyl)acetyl-CoA isomerase
MESDTIKFEMIGGVAKITLNRPNVFNSFNREMAQTLQARLDYCATEKSVRAIYLTGEGKAFCAGQDLQEATDPNGPGIERIVEEHYNPIIFKLREIEKPIVCAVNGVAAGAGANIALACDITVAKKSSAFIQAFSSIGLIPDSGGTFFLPRLVGMQKAAALMMLADKVSAEEAESTGMIYKSIEDESFESEAMAIADKLSKRPTVGTGLTKRLLNETYQNDLAEQLNREGQEQVVAAASKDYKEGVRAFLEKRKPSFTGE